MPHPYNYVGLDVLVTQEAAQTHSRPLQTGSIRPLHFTLLKRHALTFQFCKQISPLAFSIQGGLSAFVMPKACGVNLTPPNTLFPPTRMVNIEQNRSTFALGEIVWLAVGSSHWVQ
jgi:hypothetical protein